MVEKPTYSRSRTELIKKWVDENDGLINQTNRTKIVLNLKDLDVVGEVTHFPTPIKTQVKK